MDTIRLFRVEKLRRAVRVVLTDGRRLDGDVFLAERTRVRAEPQEPIDLLNEDAPFFPFFLNEQEVLLVAKDQVTRVETAAPEGDPSADMPDGAMAVEITLIDGSTDQRLRPAREARRTDPTPRFPERLREAIHPRLLGRAGVPRESTSHRQREPTDLTCLNSTVCFLPSSATRRMPSRSTRAIRRSSRFRVRRAPVTKSPLTAQQVIGLLKEIAPPDAGRQLDTTKSATFTYTSADGAFAVRAAQEGGKWRARITPGSGVPSARTDNGFDPLAGSAVDGVDPHAVGVAAARRRAADAGGGTAGDADATA